jgi:hypothetical protein
VEETVINVEDQDTGQGIAALDLVDLVVLTAKGVLQVAWTFVMEGEDQINATNATDLVILLEIVEWTKIAATNVTSWDTLLKNVIKRLILCFHTLPQGLATTVRALDMSSGTAQSWVVGPVTDVERMATWHVIVLKTVVLMNANVMAVVELDIFPGSARLQIVLLEKTVSDVVQLTIWPGIALSQPAKHSVITVTNWAT